MKRRARLECYPADAAWGTAVLANPEGVVRATQAVCSVAEAGFGAIADRSAATDREAIRIPSAASGIPSAG